MNGPRVGRPPGPTRDKSERREELLNAAVAAIAEHGPDVTMQQIADGADVTRPILYQHFTDRAGLAVALLDRYAKQVTTSVTKDFDTSKSLVQAIIPAVDSFFEFAENNPNLYRFLRIAAASDESTTPLDDVVGGAMKDLVAVFLTERGADPAMAEVWGRAILAMILGVSEWWMITRALPRATVVEHLREMLRFGLDPEQDRD